MKAWFWIKAAIGLIVIGTIFIVGLVVGGTSASAGIDEVRIKQLASCLPITTTDELGMCMGLKIVGGQR